MTAGRLLLLASLAITPAIAQYVYDYPALLNPYSASQWTANGSISASNNMVTSSTSGSLIFAPTMPAPSDEYEIKATLALTASGGNYNFYIRASSNALNSTDTGTGMIVQFANPTFSGSTCATLLQIYEIGYGLSYLARGVPCHNGMVVRVVDHKPTLYVYIDNILYAQIEQSGNPSTQPGIGVEQAPAGNGFTAVALGHLDSIAPNPISSLSGSGFRGRVDLEWPATTDDPNGTGVYDYIVSRNGVVLGDTFSTFFEDYTAGTSGTYSYTVQAVDYHGNTTSIGTNVTNSGQVDARETGVQPLGSYWGGSGEQIDMRSGNLNYSIPLVSGMGRNGKGVTFRLSYNSQSWRQDSGGVFQLGGDTGYGFGWRLTVGSLTPIYNGAWNLVGYLFIDATGAEHLLTEYNGYGHGEWSSQDGINVYAYSSSPLEIGFPDGSLWWMSCTSVDSEPDAGTSYPTKIEDNNGNIIAITYSPGMGMGTFLNANGIQIVGPNTSSRIATIEDVRGNGIADYTFHYTYLNSTDRFPHLTSITNSIGTAENYSFTYANGALISPFNGASFGTFPFQQSITQTGIPLTTSFTYDSSGSGELDQVTTPYGGHLRWTYTPYTLANSVTYREVENRFLSMSSGASETEVQLVRGNDSSYDVHSSATLDDLTANAEKYWSFQTDPSQFDVGLQLTYEERSLPSHTALKHLDFSWAQTPHTAITYLSNTLTTLDPGQSYQAQTQTSQTEDEYGRVTQTQVYNFGNLSTPARTYTNTYGMYINGAPITNYNMLGTSTVTDGTNSATLVSNSYDTTTLTNVTGSYEHDDGSYGTYYTQRGNLTNSTTPTATTTNYYDTTGNLVSTTVNGVTTGISVTSATNYVKPSQTTTNSFNTTATWYGFLGLNTATGANGETGSVIYDANARPTSTTSPYGAVTNFTYNDTASPPNKIATTNGHWSQTVMDGFGRTVQTNTGYGTTTVSTVDTVYAPCGCSPLGKLSKTSAPYAPGGSDAWTTYTYDASGRTTSVVKPDGSTTTYIYHGNYVYVYDPAGNWKVYVMDAFGNLVDVYEPDPALGTVVTGYGYDVLNHLTYVWMTRGSNSQNRAFNYNTGTTVTGLLQSSTTPEAGTVTYTYNSNNLLLTKTDAKGQVFKYFYDSYNRVTMVLLGTADPLRWYYYDTNSLDSSYSGSYTNGRLVAVRNNGFQPSQNTPSIAFTEMFAYTKAGEMSGKRLQVNETISTGTLTSNLDTAYTYDNEGKMTSVSYPTTSAGAGPTYTNSFDSMSRLIGMTDQNSNTDVSGVSYNAANQVTGISYFGANESRQYNNLQQLTQLTVTGNANISYTYNYPASTNNGQISSQVVSGETITYQYDSLKRLIAATSSAGWGENYGYDSFGNLTAMTPTAGTPPQLSQAVNPVNNQIVGQNYDANGNQLSAAVGTLTYDSENHLLTAPGVQYAYDSTNKRIWAGTLNGSGDLTAQAVFVYGANGNMLGEYSVTVGSSSLTITPMNLTVYFGNKRIGITNSSGLTTAFAPDQQGSSGQFYPYGEGKDGNTPTDAWSFATYWTDSATNLDYANWRYFTGQFGRFMTPDPYRGAADPATPLSWNRYIYSLDDPINLTDPLGLRPPTKSGSGFDHVLKGTAKILLGGGIEAGIITGTATTGVGGAVVAGLSAGAGLGELFGGAFEVACGLVRGQRGAMYCQASEAVQSGTNVYKITVTAISSLLTCNCPNAVSVTSTILGFAAGVTFAPSDPLLYLDFLQGIIDFETPGQTSEPGTQEDVTSTVSYPSGSQESVTSTVTYPPASPNAQINPLDLYWPSAAAPTPSFSPGVSVNPYTAIGSAATPYELVTSVY